MKYLLVVDHLVDSIPDAANKFIEQGLVSELGILFLARKPEAYTHVDPKGLVLITKQCSFEDNEEIRRLLEPYKDDILGIVCRGDKQVQFLRSLIPFLPQNVKVSSAGSLQAATNKRLMREAFAGFAPEITPKHIRVHSSVSADEVEHTMDYPVIVKPASLVSSLLIQKCEDRMALEAALGQTFEAVEAIYRREDRRDTPEVIVEEYLEGDFYSVDAYVRDSEQMYFCPPVAYVPAQQIGIDDFFLYKRFVPTQLTDQETQDAFAATRKALLAIKLVYSSAHVELIKTKSGWKIIEVGPRVGRFRNAMYKLGYGIDHSFNDIAVHLDIEPVIPTKLEQYCTAYSIYPGSEGVLKSIENLEAIQQSPLLHSLRVLAQPGDTVKFAKNGGKALAEFIVATPEKQAYDDLTAFIEKNITAVV